MEEREYENKLKKIDEDYLKAKKELYIEFAISNAKFKKGDIISDSTTTIKIQNFSTHKSIGLPCIVYRGPELKKDLTPKKNGDIGSIYGDGRTVNLVKEAE